MVTVSNQISGQESRFHNISNKKSELYFWKLSILLKKSTNKSISFSVYKDFILDLNFLINTGFYVMNKKILKKINLQKEEILFYFNNKILEGSTTNLIFVNGNKLFIPKNHYYYGITLEYLIKNLPYKIHRTDINISSLHQFSEILLVGSGKGVVSISFIKQFNWYRSSMKIYNFLSKKYSKILLK